ncbi:MAG: hypothetical protein V3S01_01155 [Dehalococcoidia bacterium]
MTWPWYYRVKRWLPERTGEPCRLLAQSKKGARLIQFRDGALYVVPFWAVRRRK